MSLKFSDALKLSWTNISAHKTRSVLVVITMSVFFIFILGLNLVFRGVENTVLNAATLGSHSKIYVETGFVPSVESYEIDPSLLPDHADQIIEQLVTRYHGAKVGDLTLYKFENLKVENPDTPNQTIYFIPDWYEVIDVAAVTDFLSADTSSVPSDKIPVITPKGKTLTREQSQLFTIIGQFPLSQNISLRLPGSFSVLNLVLEDTNGRTDSAFLNNFLIIDDGRESIKEFIADRAARMHQEAEAAHTFSRLATQTIAIAKFDRADDAANYYLGVPRDGNEFGYTCDYAQTYLCQTQDLFGNAVSIAASFNRFNFFMFLLEIVFLIIAACIAAMTLTHIINEDAAIIALYRSLGASTKDIYLVYILYLLELCIVTIALCFIAAITCAGILTLLHADSLSSILQKAYQLSEPPSVTMLEFSPQFFLILFSILFIAPLSLLLAASNFSPKAISKKLKAN